MSTQPDRERPTRGVQSTEIELRRKLSFGPSAERANKHLFPRLGYALASITLVAIAFLVLDTPLGHAAKHLPPMLVAIAGSVTDIGTLASTLTLAGAVAAGCLLSAAVSNDARRLFRLVHSCRIAGYLAVSLVLTSSVVHILKSAIGRARPPLFGEYGILHFEPLHGGFLFQSFPSAHAANVGCLFMAFSLLAPRFRLAFLGIALWLAATRIIIGVHYPSDVIAGLLLGGWFSIIAALLFARRGQVFEIAADGWPRLRLERPFRRRKRRNFV
jgi:undecaprenyl-diphosphatase